MDPNKIYEVLRKKIINLELAPGTVLNLSELALEFNVSRTPIKEVLIALQAEEWITRHGPHFIVTPLSLERIREITEIRMILEIQANIWAMQRITAPELESLEKIKKQISLLTEKTANQKIVDLDFEIHHILFKATKNINLERMLERILSHYLRFWLSIPRQIDHSVFFSETLELIDAIREKDESLVRECTARHIRNSVAEIMGTR